MVNKVFLGLGSNRDNRLWYLFQAFRYLASAPAVSVLDVSSIYETEPYGVKEQRNFLNAVVEIETGFPPGRLLQFIKFIEKKIGRIERGRWAPREIDIDILTYGDKIVQLPWLTIPHFELHKRRFVLIPFNEIADDFIVPAHGRTVQTLLDRCEDSGSVKQIISGFEVQEQLDELISQVELSH